jgi:predicted Zn-dependent protease
VTRRPALRGLAALLAGLLALPGCAVNPVTGERELVLMSPEREASVGRQAAQEVEQQIGLVRDRDLEAYVQSVGERVARHSPRQDVEWHFAVADMQEPNAFALPGGWIYVSRGLLAITNGEDELANVIGHEIGHVAARHSAKRETQALGVTLLTMLGVLAAGATGGAQAAQAVGQLGQVAGAGLIASYGRDQERESDDLGQRLAAQAGYDPAGMAKFLHTLERESTLGEGKTRLPSFLDSHPMTGERVEAAQARAGTLSFRREPGVSASRADFLRRLDGLLVGPDPAEGVFRDEHFLHPGFGIALDFPEGWKTVNQKSAVGATSPQQDAAVILEVQEPPGRADEAASRFASANEIPLRDARRLEIGGYDAVRAWSMGSGPQGEIGVDLTWYAHPKAVLRMAGVSPAAQFERRVRLFHDVAVSLRPLSSEERASLRERRLRVVEAEAGESLAELGRRTGNRWSVEETAVANALEPSAKPSAGQPIKIAVEVPWQGDD